MSELGRNLYRKWLPELWHAETAAMPELARELFTADAVGHWPDGTDYHGPDAIAEVVARGRDMFEAVTVSLLTGPVADDELVCARWEFRGRVAVEGMGVEPGTEMRIIGLDMFRIAGDRFSEYWNYSTVFS